MKYSSQSKSNFVSTKLAMQVIKTILLEKSYTPIWKAQIQSRKNLTKENKLLKKNPWRSKLREANGRRNPNRFRWLGGYSGRVGRIWNGNIPDQNQTRQNSAKHFPDVKKCTPLI